MPAIKRVSFTNIFSQLNSISYSEGETNDCSVKAVALVVGCTYAAAKAALAARGRKDRKGAYTSDILAAIRSFGKTTLCISSREIMSRYPEPHRSVLKNITTHHPRRFNKVWPKGAYLLFSKRHVSACINGELHDWAVNSAKRVVAIYEVNK